MDATRLHPELRKAVERVPRLPFGSRLLLPLARAIFDVAVRKKPLPDADVRTESHGGISMEVSRPTANASGAALLWMHGGGHVAGTPRSLVEIASRLSQELGVVVVAPRYRLAPRHPFPADLEDCRSAWDWMQASADSLGIDPARIALVGNSAGGGIAAALAQQLRHDGGVQPCAQVLFYPMLDDRTAARTELDAVRHFVWTNRANRVAWKAYLAPHEPGAPALPDYAAPARRASLAGLPPTWLGVGELDLFFEEDVRYAERLREAGVPCELVRVEGAPHAFDVLVPDAPVSRGFVRSAVEFLAKHLDAGPAR